VQKFLMTYEFFSYTLSDVTVVSNTYWFMHCFVTCDMFYKLLVFYKRLEIVIVVS